jgi:NitT/TauT family transport system substrate-binding protein
MTVTLNFGHSLLATREKNRHRQTLNAPASASRPRSAGRRGALLAAMAVSGALLLASCSSSSPASSKHASPVPSASVASAASATGSLTIAGLTDLGYAPFYLLAAKGWLQQALPHVSIHWEFLASGAAVESEMISGQINVASLGLAPFLVGWNKGVDWKILSSFGPNNEYLITWMPQIKSLKDFTPADKIAILAPTSIQAIALEKAADEQLHNPHALDENMVALPHAVAYQAWKQHTIAADFSAVPFQGEELAAGGHSILSLNGIFHTDITPNVVAVEQPFYDSHRTEMAVLYAQIQRALAYLTDHPNRSATAIAAYEGKGVTPAEVKKAIDNPAIQWSVAPGGLEAYATFMRQIGLISKTLTSWKQLVYPNLYGVNGS